jgi:hypothetical protein
MPRPIGLDISGTIAGCALIYLFYTAVRTRWPANYASSTNDFGMIVNRTVARYTAFALAPTYIVGLLAGTTVTRAGGDGRLTALSIGAFHVLRMYSVKITRTLRNDHTATRIPALILDGTLAAGVILIAYVAGLGPGRFTFVVPPVDEFFKSLWGTVFVAMVAAIVISKTNVQFDIARLITRSRKEVGAKLITLARDEAKRVGASPDLAEAVLLTENLQRPRWFRTLERVKGRIFPRGSYGVMQVMADRPLSDEESIRKAVEIHLPDIQVDHDKNGYPVHRSLDAALKTYNPDSVFVDLASSIYWQIRTPIPMTPSKTDGDRAGEAEPTTTDTPVARRASEEVAASSEKLAAETAQLCLFAAMLLASATADELRALKNAVAKFLSAQLSRPGQSPLTIDSDMSNESSQSAD